MRRRGLRILAVAAAILIVALIAVQIVLWTSIPRRIVIGRIESQLGLRLTTSSLATGWFGTTNLKDVTLSLPLAENALVDVRRLRVRHTSLLGLLFTRSLVIKEMDLDQPHLQVVQAPDGRWNLQEVIELLARTGGKKNTDSNALTRLPRLHIVDATVTVTDRSNRQAVVAPVTIDGYAESALSWRYDLSIPGHVTVKGRLVPDETWEHAADIDIRDVSQWLSAWAKLPPDLALSGRWTGRLSGPQLQGRLEMKSFTGSGTHLAGAVDVTQQGDLIEVRPDRLAADTKLVGLPDVNVISGKLSYDGKIARAENLQLAVYGGPATLGGWFEPATQTGQIQAAWDQLQLPGGVRHGGNLLANVRRPFPQQTSVDGSLASFGTSPSGPWRGKVGFTASADAAFNGAWHIDAPELKWDRKQPVKLDGMQLAGSFRGEDHALPTVVLESTRIPADTQMSGQGEYRLSDRSWTLRVRGDHWPFHPIEGEELSFDLDLSGTSALVELRLFELRSRDGEFNARGSYRFGQPKPLHVAVKLDNHPTNAQPNPALLLQGLVDGEADLDGTLAPMQLSLGGDLYGAKVSVVGRTIGDLRIKLAGLIDADKADVRTQQLSALGGNWSLRGNYDFSAAILDIGISVTGLPLRNLTQITQTDPITGTLRGEWDAYLYGLRLDPRRVRLSGGGSIEALHAVRFADADEVKFGTTLENGELRIDPIILKRGGQGTGSAVLTLNIDNPRHIETQNISFANWPLDDGLAHAIASATIPRAAIDLPRKATAQLPAVPLQVSAPAARLQVDVEIDGKPAGNATVSGSMAGRLITAQTAHADLLDGGLDADFSFDLDRPLEARGEFSFANLNAARLTDFIPQLQGLEGSLHGAGHLRPAQAPRPLEPLGFGLQAVCDKGQFRNVPIRLINLNLFFNTDRVVLDDRPGHDSTIELAGGVARLWGRLSRRRGELWATQSQIRLENLNLDQIVHAADPTSAPTPGRLSGNIMLLYDTAQKSARVVDAGAKKLPAPPTTRPVRPAFRRFVENVYGEANLTLDDSSIAALPVISQLYDVMSLGASARGPTGNGAFAGRMENGTLTLSRFRYFNRGLEVRSQLVSPEMWYFPDNRVNATAVGSLQPLKAIKLPFFGDLQGILDVLQKNLTTVATTPNATWRTLRTSVRPIPFAAAGEDIRAFIFGDLNGTEEGQ